MFVKYDEYDLLELFQNEPMSIKGNIYDEELIYTYKDQQNFKVILTLDTYKQTISLSITFNDAIVFTGDFNNVTSIKKDDKYMVIYVNGEERLKVKFYKQVGVELL
ncbi:hypothetical protein HXA31_11615 [Salipaludibacillus agaradhaerens]|uniref:Uncharacterized protein n=1 Tax=Salipaludibacillus agaradhaerens TaxID=76935 RepID=A0A9Q4FXT6_SALAG|nr:hypothetical protein [Salipaludibacillus agaradhaerens]MCR6095417.1 hypothetical protein [Salipaludibacillus agaradhaerens]MCR6115023.1 hypothetical protein [Salipaludibacillus agaradhaerens]